MPSTATRPCFYNLGGSRYSYNQGCDRFDECCHCMKLPDPKPDPKAAATRSYVERETIESLAVAFILALIFKAFIAEAFVIPTGSMAPTLMGAHKDTVCQECGFPYQTGASSEYTEGAKNNLLVFATVCPLCRKPQSLDLENNANHRTFTGDRILVSKLAYVFSKPERWHVFVFKHLEEAHLNFIKRCVGLPGETIRIEHGDVYIGDKPTSPLAIARKPPHVIQAMLQPLSDTRFPAKSLIRAKVPDAWQVSEGSDGSWTIGYEGDKWSAKVDGVPSGAMSMIRYRHRVLDPLQWSSIRSERMVPQPIAADSYRLITDFTAYNASFSLAGMKSIPNNYSATADQLLGNKLTQSPIENDGLHWTGDLSGGWEIATDPSTEILRLLLVEAGVEHLCDIDLKTGMATATLVYQGKKLAAFESGEGGWVDSIRAPTSVRAGSKHRVQLANIDDSLTLWVDGSPVSWGNQGRFSILAAVPQFEHTPRVEPGNPLDTAPLGIGVQGGACTITHARVDRDIYYIAYTPPLFLPTNDDPLRQLITDYGDPGRTLQEARLGEVREKYRKTFHDIEARQYARLVSDTALTRNALLSDVEAWSGSSMDKQRQTVTYNMKDGNYFPMGDNSSASSDARSWREHHVPEDLLIGRAILVFWPHYWNAPIPFLPNFQRMGLIR